MAKNLATPPLTRYSSNSVITGDISFHSSQTKQMCLFYFIRFLIMRSYKPKCAYAHSVNTANCNLLSFIHFFH